MAEATAVTGRMDTPITAGMIVLVALSALVGLRRIVVNFK